MPFVPPLTAHLKDGFATASGDKSAAFLKMHHVQHGPGLPLDLTFPGLMGGISFLETKKTGVTRWSRPRLACLVVRVTYLAAGAACGATGAP
jgi:hypothetical protein